MLAVAWYDTRDRHAQIRARVIAGASSRELTLTNGKRHAYEPSLQLTSDALVVAWYDKSGASGTLTARLGAWAFDGRSLWQTRLSVADRNGRNPVVRISGDRIFCTWLEGEQGHAPSVWGAWFDRDGRVVSRAQRLATASRDTWNLNAAVDTGGTAWVVFDARVGTRASELYLVTARSGAHDAAVRLTTDDGFHSVYPDIAVSQRRLALTWFDERDGNREVYLATAPADEQLSQEALSGLAHRVTHTPGASIGAYLTWNGSVGGLAWSDDTAGHYDVFFQTFDAGGRLTGTSQQLSHTEAWSLIPSITAWREGFGIAWNEYRPEATGNPSSSSVVWSRVTSASLSEMQAQSDTSPALP